MQEFAPQILVGISPHYGVLSYRVKKRALLVFFTLIIAVQPQIYIKKLKSNTKVIELTWMFY